MRPNVVRSAYRKPSRIASDRDPAWMILKHNMSIISASLKSRRSRTSESDNAHLVKQCRWHPHLDGRTSCSHAHGFAISSFDSHGAIDAMTVIVRLGYLIHNRLRSQQLIHNNWTDHLQGYRTPSDPTFAKAHQHYTIDQREHLGSRNYRSGKPFSARRLIIAMYVLLWPQSFAEKGTVSQLVPLGKDAQRKS